MVRVLFVCMGNICRSPTAQGVFERVLLENGLEGHVEVDSAGTHGYHVGRSPDSRSREAALARGIDIGRQRARQFERSDFEYFDYVLAMDQSNLAVLLAECPDAHRDRVGLFMEFAPDSPVRDVPDPYYGGSQGFEHVLDLVEQASQGLLHVIRERHGL